MECKLVQVIRSIDKILREKIDKAHYKKIVEYRK